MMQLIATQIMDKIDKLKMGIEDIGDVIPEVYQKNRMHWV